MEQNVIDRSRDKNEFDDWLEKHNLKDVKQIFIDHKMNTLSDMSLQNESLGPLVTDQRFNNKPNIVMTILAAIQSLDKQKQQLMSKNVYIIVSPKETEIMKQLQQNVDELQNKAKQIHDTFNNKIISNNNTLKQYKTKCSAELTVITNHVMKYMNQLKELVKHKQSCLYKEINVHQTKLTQRKSKHMKAVNKIDSAIDETLNKYSTTINEAIQHYKNKIDECETIMKTCNVKDDIFSHNAEREKRIVAIAKNAQVHFTNTNNKINEYEKRIKRIRMDSDKSQMIFNHSLVSHHEDEKKSYEYTNSIYPWTMHINQPLYKEINKDINSIISITIHSKYEKQLKLVKLYEKNKSDKKSIEMLQLKKNDLYKKVTKYQTHFEEKKNDEIQYADISVTNEIAMTKTKTNNNNQTLQTDVKKNEHEYSVESDSEIP